MRVANDLTQAELKELLYYNRETGEFRWRAERRPGIKAWSLAGGLMPRGYVQIMIKQCNYVAHRLAWLYVHGSWPPDQIDHINRDKVDNRIDNLREANDSENQQNKSAVRANGRLLGTTWSKAAGRWAAQIKKDGVRKHLGLFDTEREAHEAYVEAKRNLHSFGGL